MSSNQNSNLVSQLLFELTNSGIIFNIKGKFFNMNKKDSEKND